MKQTDTSASPTVRMRESRPTRVNVHRVGAAAGDGSDDGDGEGGRAGRQAHSFHYGLGKKNRLIKSKHWWSDQSSSFFSPIGSETGHVTRSMALGGLDFWNMEAIDDDGVRVGTTLKDVWPTLNVALPLDLMRDDRHAIVDRAIHSHKADL